MARKRKRGREGQRPRKVGRKFETYTSGRFVLSIDTRTGQLTSFGHGDPAVGTPAARNAVTAWAIETLAKYGHVPADPVSVRDGIWG